MQNLIGKTLNKRYRVEEFLGRGGMADVYKVWDSRRVSYLAMKVLQADLAYDRLFIRRFEREAKRLAGLQHPNIVRFYGFEEEDMLVYFLMEYVEGSSLKAEIFRQKGRPMNAGQIRKVLRPVCSALYYAHQNDLVHCDIKPANIMLNKQGQVFLADFGIARTSEAATTATLVGMGTPAYMAPEQVKGLDPTPQTDIYALGIVLYEMLTGGERPFTGERAGVTGSLSAKVRWEQLNLEPLPVEQFNPGLSPALVALVGKCLTKNPQGRYADSLQFLNALELALGDGVVMPQVQPPLSAAAESDKVEQASMGGKLWEEDERLKVQLGETGQARVEENVAAGRKLPSWAWILAGGVGILVLLLLVNSLGGGGGRGGLAFVPSRTPARTQILPQMTIELPEPTLTEMDRATSTKKQTAAQENTEDIDTLEETKGSLSITDTLTATLVPTTTFTSTATFTQTATQTPLADRWKKGRLAFTRRTSSGAELNLLNLNTDEMITLQTAKTESYLLGAAISPDGAQIAYYCYPDQLFVADLISGSTPKQIDSCQSPVWSSDGSNILCKAGGNVFKWAGGSSISGVHGVIPALSPNSQYLVFAAFENQTTNIHCFDINKNSLSLIAGDASENYAPSVSPDGYWVAYQSNENSENSEIWIMHLDGSHKKQITFSGPGNWSRAPVWSPDGEWLAFISNQNGSIGADFGEVFVISTLGGESYQITSTNGNIYDWRVSWAP